MAALGLLLFAPTVSRITMAPSFDLGAWCAGHSLSERHRHPATPELPITGDACDYCSFLGHSPALTGSITPLIQGIPAAPFAVVGVVLGTPLLRPLLLRSRGPPAH